jgi:hypothetical protein
VVHLPLGFQQRDKETCSKFEDPLIVSELLMFQTTVLEHDGGHTMNVINANKFLEESVDNQKVV